MAWKTTGKPIGRSQVEYEREQAALAAELERAEQERLKQYLICKTRGHSSEGGYVYNHDDARVPRDVNGAKRCRYCQVIFWDETVKHELDAPTTTEDTDDAGTATD